MQKLYSLCKKRLQPLFCATAGILYMTMLTAQPVFAEDVATGGENIWSASPRSCKMSMASW